MSETATITVERMAHGGRGIGTIDGKVVFVAGAFPGDVVDAAITKNKKSHAQAEIARILEPSALRTEEPCPAFAAGAGCCDFSPLAPAAQLRLKEEILNDQLSRLGGLEELPPIAARSLAPATGWRTRARLGVDAEGRAGFRRARSREVLAGKECAQNAPGLLAGVVGEGAGRFTPGAELIAALGSNGRRGLVETRRAGRGRRAERVERRLDGPAAVEQVVGEDRFSVPVAAFWQAHEAAPEAYVDIVSGLAEEGLAEAGPGRSVGWDLYGGVGLFVPTIASALGEGAEIHSVDLSRAAGGATNPEPRLATRRFHRARVESAVAHLPRPRLVVLDPPRSGAGEAVVGRVAAAAPSAVVHVGCDPATLARDLGAWARAGYRARRVELVDAFPGTHHAEAIALLTPA